MESACFKNVDKKIKQPEESLFIFNVFLPVLMGRGHNLSFYPFLFLLTKMFFLRIDNGMLSS